MGFLLDGFRSLPRHGLGGVAVLLLYVLQGEVRFGARARSHSAASSDRGSTIAVSLAAALPVLGFVLAMKTDWFRGAPLPGMPAIAWGGVALGGLGLAVRIWAVLTLRERYTRTLLIQAEHSVERRGPYRWVRHPGYLGSLLSLNGVAAASGSLVVLIASLAATLAAYAYRIRVEDEMLIQRFGEAYAAYRREVATLIPWTAGLARLRSPGWSKKGGRKRNRSR